MSNALRVGPTGEGGFTVKFWKQSSFILYYLCDTKKIAKNSQHLVEQPLEVKKKFESQQKYFLGEQPLKVKKKFESQEKYFSVEHPLEVKKSLNLRKKSFASSWKARLWCFFCS